MRRPGNEEAQAVGAAGLRVELGTRDRAHCAASSPRVKGCALLAFEYVQTPAYLRGDANRRREMFVKVAHARRPTAIVRVASCA